MVCPVNWLSRISMILNGTNSSRSFDTILFPKLCVECKRGGIIVKHNVIWL